VNLTVTLPAFAVSLLVSNMSMSPIGARLTVFVAFAAGGRFGGGVFVVDVGAGNLPVAPRRYATISCFWRDELGKLAAVMTVSPTTPTGALVPAESFVFHSTSPVFSRSAYRVPSNVVVNTTLLAIVAAPYADDGSLWPHRILPGA